MEKLQDRVPAKSGKEAWDLLYSAAPGGKVGFHKKFSDFDDVPLAAASLGQVHRATLRDSGALVAIKRDDSHSTRASLTSTALKSNPPMPSYYTLTMMSSTPMATVNHKY
eukprot:scaffold7176_cov112-Skeletonema_menzelii.AAC.1